MGNTRQTSVYVRNGRLHAVQVNRPTGFGPWPQVSHPFMTNELIARVEGELGELELTYRSPLATRNQIAQAIALHHGINPQNFNQRIWSHVPHEMRERIRDSANRAAEIIARRYRKFSNEEAMTGALFSSFEDHLEAQGWTARFNFVEFSKQSKENVTGADIAVVIEVFQLDGSCSVKTLWFQAKRREKISDSWINAPRLEEQMSRMQNFTNQSYALIYAHDNTYVCAPSLGQPMPLGQFLEATMACMYGDPGVEILAESLNRMKRFEIIVSQNS